MKWNKSEPDSLIPPLICVGGANTKRRKWESYITCSILSIRQVWRDGNSPLLPEAEPQQSLIHTWNHVTHPDVGVVGAVPLVAVHSQENWGGSNHVTGSNMIDMGSKLQTKQKENVANWLKTELTWCQRCPRSGRFHYNGTGYNPPPPSCGCTSQAPSAPRWWCCLLGCAGPPAGHQTPMSPAGESPNLAPGQNVAPWQRARRRETVGLCGRLTWALFAVGFERWDEDIPDLAHTHPQQALIHALYQPALTHQRVVGLLPGVATQGSYNRKVKHTTHLGDAVQIQSYSFSHSAPAIGQQPVRTYAQRRKSGFTWSRTRYRPAGCRWNGSGQSRCALPSACSLSGCWWFGRQPGRLCSTRPAGGCRTPAWNQGEPPRLETRCDLTKRSAHVVMQNLWTGRNFLARFSSNIVGLKRSS